MSTCNHTKLEIKGSVDEVIAVLKGIKAFEKTEDVYLDSVRINKKDKFYNLKSGDADFDSMKQSELIEYVTKAKGHVFLEAEGPWGRFDELEEVELFERLADEAPGAYISGYMSARGYSYQSIDGELLDGELKLGIIYPEEYGLEKDKDTGYNAVNYYDPMERKYIEEDISDARTIGDLIILMKSSKSSHNQKVDKIVEAIKNVITYDDFIKIMDYSKEELSESRYEQLLYNYDMFGANYYAFCEFTTVNGVAPTEEKYNEVLRTIMDKEYVQ